ncbi:hypothetical protein DO021_20415 [Desulfobacter hydrogenophilus]|uniref:LysM domain-containing protein n=1 Tax=Desulfobacter hydrogenophilus TaxID=2291 RepID=A0A328FAS5_9BACT|nr:LysM domain-containing protein [Desulfobacter hydrogenophilus]NDY74239.1 LysM peptidoglycan-binding domain-containing protein [Desulfobacter hydrogenophilus]QBH14558.1 LysM domain-containing protein [Desulfobacter hydrogenophilus]RAM00183.1 hypothetical protein DO021_20415 [Desulfobacter hydrogenophilus]
MDQQLKKIRDGFANAPSGPVTINAAFWTAAGVTPPEGFDDTIKAAYRLPESAAGLVVNYDRQNVSEVIDNRFSVTGVTLIFLNSGDNAASAVIEGIGTGGTPTLGIDVTPPDGWNLGTLFTYMAAAGWPLSWLLENKQLFYFTTADADKIERLKTNLPVIKGQNIYGEMGVPDSAKLLFSLVSGFSYPSGNLPASGPIVLNKALGVDSPTPPEEESVILYPDFDYTAFIPESSPLALLFLKVSKPRLSIVVTTSEEKDDDGKTFYDQRPAFGFALEMTLVGMDGIEVPMLLAAQVGLPVDPKKSKANSYYQFSVARVDDDHRITPTAIVSLMAGQSYFSQTPPVLQQYLSAVEMLGFTMAGRIGVAYPDSIGLVIGSDGGPPPLFTDPGNSQPFEIKSFALNWRMLNPLDAKTRQSMVSFETIFTLFPTIFKQKNGDDGGEFSVLIDQDLNMEGRFDGTASLDDILSGITGGAVGMPEGVSASFSDIYTTISPSQKSYSFGFTVDAEIDIPFISYDGKPLVQLVGMTFQLAAVTPAKKDPSDNAATVYTGAIDGVAIVGPVSLNIGVNYDEAGDPPTWKMKTSLANNIDLIELTNQFFEAYGLPEFLPGKLTVEAFNLEATVPVVKKSQTANQLGSGRARSAVASWRTPLRQPLRSAHRHLSAALASTENAQPKSSYLISGKLRWEFPLTPEIPVKITADMGLNYDGNRAITPVDQRFAGWVIGTLEIDLIGSVEIGYRFGPSDADSGSSTLRLPLTTELAEAAATGDSKTLWMAWNGFRAAYDFVEQQVTFSLTGWTLGQLIESMVQMVADPYFTLASPWDLLNKISLSGLSLSFDLKKDEIKPFVSRVSCNYALPSSLNLGFMTIKGFKLRQIDGSTTLLIDGVTDIPGVKNSPLFNSSQNDGKGQDVQNMPSVPGQGNKLFDLRLLALGQRVAIYDPGSDMRTTKAVIAALEKVPASSGKDLPFDPSKQVTGQPYYHQSSNWLAAMHFGILEIPGFKPRQFTLDMMIVFNDPDMYGLRIEMAGEKAKALAGLAIDILYKKVTDDIGLYQIDFTFPSILRNLDFGAVSVVLPSIGIQIYTNGDFLIDLGFPHNNNFSRSFTFQAIIYGVPVLGSGGLYFGKLSNATAKGIPQTTKGAFSSVILFGLGAQIGLGRYIDKGVFKAGFSITIFGIIEGTIAAWHPYEKSGEPQEKGLVQGDYYFKLAGTFGIIGKLYGTVDFGIIFANVNLTVEVYMKIVYESYCAIPLSLTARVSVSASVNINLGVFKITISFSFKLTITETLTIGSDQRNLSPWYDGASVQRLRLGDLALAGPPLRLNFSGATKRSLATAPRVSVAATAFTKFSVIAPENSGYDAQEGAGVLLFAIDAPVATSSGSGANTSFGKLNKAFFGWLVNHIEETEYAGPLPTAGEATTTRVHLEAMLALLSDPLNQPFSAYDLNTFFADNCDVTISGPTVESQKALADGSVIFPAFSFFKMTVPNPNGVEPPTVNLWFGQYTTADDAYQEAVRLLFASVAANVEAEGKKDKLSVKAAPGGNAEPMADLVYVNYFVLLARQLVQSAIDAFDDYAYPLKGMESINDILSWGRDLGNVDLTPEDVVGGNMSYPLAANKKIVIGDVHHTIQASDTLSAVASRYSDDAASDKRWTTTVASLITWNANQNNLILAGKKIELKVGGVSMIYTTKPGDSFNSLAEAFGITIDALSEETTLYGIEGVLAPGIVLPISPISYTTASGDSDTLQSVLERFASPLDAFLSVEENLSAAGLFSMDGNLRFAIVNLTTLDVDDIWDVILRTDTLGQIAGIASRFMMHGMRLPNDRGLALSTGFLYGSPYWPDTQSAYGLYQLTGQQFPLSANGTTVSLTFSDATGPSWLTFNDGAGVNFDISDQINLANAVTTWAKNNGYKPKTTINREPGMVLSPRKFTMASRSPWTGSNVAELARVTAIPSGSDAAAAATENAPQGQPYLWALSSGLMTSLADRQKRLTALCANVADMTPYLPLMFPVVSVTDPASSTTGYLPIKGYTLATRIDFRVKRLAQLDDLAPPLPDANDIVPPGPGNDGSNARALAPFAYELVGPSPADAILLQRMLTAIDSLGEKTLSDIFLLYNDESDGSNGLMNRGKSEFLSFIVQSNLSTETNPPPILFAAKDAAKDEKVSGIANSPTDFVKLMWELSTVNQGGYYLYYQSFKEGDGLPPGIFDDSGIAVLTIVITLARNEASPVGQRVFDFCNALVTVDTIDPERSIVALEGVSDPAVGKPLLGTETLDELSACYGVNLGALARSNRTVMFASGAVIPIAGLYRELTPDDCAGGKDPIQMLADYYSEGAIEPITKQDILDYNPGTKVESLSVFRIPAFNYRVEPAAAPGASFAALGDYYGISNDALGYQARNVARLFPAGAVLTIDTVVFDAQQNLGCGNTGMSVLRERGFEPDPSHSDTYPINELLQLYQLLSTNIRENAFYNRSPNTASFGPQDMDDTHHEPNGTEARMLKSSLNREYPKPRRLSRSFRASQDSHFLYQQAVAANNAFATLNAAVVPESAILPQPDDNPYRGVGGILQFNLSWQDLFGNQIPNPLSFPQPGDPPPYSGFPMPILYTDTLIPIEQWSNTETGYRYQGTKGLPELVVNFTLNVKPYLPNDTNTFALRRLNATRHGADEPIWLQNAKADLAVYTRVFYQLTQNYDAAGVPGLSGNAVSIRLVNTLLSDRTGSQPEGLHSSLVNYVEQCVLYLQAIVAAGTPVEAPSAVLTASVQLKDVSDDDIIQVSVALVLERQGLLCDPALRGLGNLGLRVESIIPAVTEAPASTVQSDVIDQDTDTTPSLVPFARGMESVFATDDWCLRIGVGSVDPASTVQSRTPSLWAVRMSLSGATSASGLDFTIGANPLHYAPRLVATALKTFNADIAPYETGQPFPAGNPQRISFSGVDPNQWYADFLTAVDTFLTPPYTTSVFVFDKLLNLDDGANASGNKGYLAKMLDYKADLAESMATTLLSIYANSSDNSHLKRAAAEKFKQALLGKLSTANTLTSISVFPVTGAKYDKSLNKDVVSPPRFYGQPQATTVKDPEQKKNNYSFSTAKVPLTKSTEEGNSALAFLFDSRHATRGAFVTMDLAYSLTHLEFDIRNVSGIKKYEQSNWISFLTGPYKRHIGDAGKDFTFPILLRALPTPPTMVAQSGSPIKTSKDGYAAVSDGAEASDLRRWSYEFSYLGSRAAQDRMLVTVEFNRPPDTKDILNASSKSTAEELYRALAQFQAIYPAVAQDLDTYLRPLNGDSDPTAQEMLDAQYALAALDNVVKNVTDKYKAWVNSSIKMAEDESAPRVVYQFEVGLNESTDADNRAIVEVVPLSFTLDNKSATNFLPVAHVEVDPKNYDAELVSSTEAGFATYQYRLKDDNGEEPTYLSYDKALTIAKRTIQFPRLDLFALQSGWSAVQVTRNQRLSPEGGPETSKEFTFLSDEVRFADPMRPLLVYPSFPLGTGNKPESMKTWLSNFFTLLLTPDTTIPFTQSILIKLEARYSYRTAELVADLPCTILPLSLLPPTNTEGKISPPFVTAVATAVQHWFDTAYPVVGTSSAFSFQLSVFSDSGKNDMPILQVRNLTIPAALVSHQGNKNTQVSGH